MNTDSETFSESGFLVIREPEYTYWPFGELPEHQKVEKHKLENRLRTTPPRIPTIFGDL